MNVFDMYGESLPDYGHRVTGCGWWKEFNMICDNTHKPFFLPLESSLSLSLFQDINKRLSLPADIRLPEGYLEKFAMNSPPFDKPMSRRLRRASLVSAQCVPVCVCVCIFFICEYVCKAAETSCYMHYAIELTMAL